MLTSSPGRLYLVAVWKFTAADGKHLDLLIRDFLKPLDTGVKLDISLVSLRPCSHPGSSAYGNTSLSVTITDGTWVTTGQYADSYENLGLWK